jgi:hypothetical protein
MVKRSKVELFEQIRKVHEREQLSTQELARRFRTHGRYVRQAFSSAVPPGEVPGVSKWPSRFRAAISLR